MADYGGKTLDQLRQAAYMVDPRMRGADDVSGNGIYDVMPDWMAFGGTSLGGLAEDYNSQLNSVNGGSTAGAAANFSDYMVSNGLKPMESSGANNSSWRWVEDAQGNVVVQPQQINNNDPAFAAAAAAAAAAVTAGVAGAGFGVGGAPAAGGGGGGLLSGAADPLAGYMTGGGAEGSIIGSGVTAAPGAAIPGGLAEAGIGTLPGSLPAGSAPLAPLPSVPSIPPVSGLPSVGGLVPAAASSAPAWLPEGLKSSWDFISKNPQLIGAIGGGLLGGAGAKDEGAPAPYTGPMPTITRGGFKADNSAGYKPMAKQSYGGGLLSTPGTKQAASGLHQYMGLLGR